LPLAWKPPIRHCVARQDAEEIRADGALGTTRSDHVPFDSRYSPTLVGNVSEPVVPSAMHEPERVQAPRCNGTEIPMEGSPVTCGTADWVPQLANTRAPAPSNAPRRHARGAWASSRLMGYAFVGEF
jgi:hypothetical protein